MTSVSGGIEGSEGFPLPIGPGNSVTCPVPGCGRLAPVIEGRYTRRGTQTHAVLKLTPSQARRLLTAAQWAADRIDADPSTAEHTTAQLRKTAEKEAPALLKLLDALASQRGMAAMSLASLLVAVLALWMSGQQHSLTEEDVMRIVEQVHEAEASTPTAPPPPSPTQEEQRPSPESTKVTPTPRASPLAMREPSTEGP